MESSCLWRYANDQTGKLQFRLRQDRDGIDLELVGTARIFNASVNRNGDEALEGDDIDQIRIVGGTFNSNQGAGIDVDDAVTIFINNVTAEFNEDNGLQIEAQDEGGDDTDPISTIQNVTIVNSNFSNNTGDGIQIAEEDDDDGNDVFPLVESVLLVNVDANSNSESGLNIQISGNLRRSNVTSQYNGSGDILP